MVNVDISYDLKKAKVSCPEKSKSEFNIRTAPGGFIFYQIETTNGKLPKALLGRFSGLDVAVKAVERYYELMPKSKAVRVENNRKRAEEHKNAATDHTEGSK